MRMRMNNEDDISREARLRKEARELEGKGIVAQINLDEEIESGVIDEEIVEAEERVVEEKKKLPKRVSKKKIVKKRK